MISGSINALLFDCSRRRTRWRRRRPPRAARVPTVCYAGDARPHFLPAPGAVTHKSLTEAVSMVIGIAFMGTIFHAIVTHLSRGVRGVTNMEIGTVLPHSRKVTGIAIPPSRKVTGIAIPHSHIVIETAIPHNRIVSEALPTSTATGTVILPSIITTGITHLLIYIKMIETAWLLT